MDDQQAAEQMQEKWAPKNNGVFSQNLRIWLEMQKASFKQTSELSDTVTALNSFLIHV